MKIHYIYVPYAQDSSKRHIKYEDDFEVALTDKEIDLIRHSIDTGAQLPADEQLRRKQKSIYKKIIAAGYAMAQYYTCHEIRMEDLVNDVCWEEVDQKALLKEDIEQQGFNPHNADGRPYSQEELLRQWVMWEADRLRSLSYPDRLKYYAERFHFGVEGILDNGFSELHFVLPEEVDCNCPTDNWWQRKIRKFLK